MAATFVAIPRADGTSYVEVSTIRAVEDHGSGVRVVYSDGLNAQVIQGTGTAADLMTAWATGEVSTGPAA